MYLFIITNLIKNKVTIYILTVNRNLIFILGLYIGYIPFTYLIERLIASLRVVSTAVFVIYLTDSFGYLGTAAVFLAKNSCVSIVAVYRYFRRQMNALTIIPTK